MDARVTIPGSETNLQSGGSWLPADPNQQISATIIIRRPAKSADISEQLLAGSRPAVTREQALRSIRVDPADLSAVRTFTQKYRLAVVAENAEARTLQVRGSIAQLGQAFGVDVALRTDPDSRQYLSYEGALTLPADLSGVVTAVLGLDQRPVAKRGVGQ